MERKKGDFETTPRRKRELLQPRDKRLLGEDMIIFSRLKWVTSPIVCKYERLWGAIKYFYYSEFVFETTNGYRFCAKSRKFVSHSRFTFHTLIFIIAIDVMYGHCISTSNCHSELQTILIETKVTTMDWRWLLSFWRFWVDLNCKVS